MISPTDTPLNKEEELEEVFHTVNTLDNKIKQSFLFIKEKTDK